MLNEKILKIVNKIDSKLTEIKHLHKYWELDTVKLINDSKVILLLASKLYKKVKEFY